MLSIYEGLVDGKDTDSIYLDYAKAFDRVDHELLISKLERYGFHPSLINWIKSFLSNRDQVVVLDGVQSFVAGILSGIVEFLKEQSWDRCCSSCSSTI